MAELLDMSPELIDQTTEMLRQRLAPLHGSDVRDYLVSEEGTLLLRTLHAANRSRLYPLILDN